MAWFETAVETDPDFRKGMKFLMDYRTVKDKHKIPHEIMWNKRNGVKNKKYVDVKHVRRAYLVSSAGIMETIRNWSKLVETTDTTLVTMSVEDAAAWLAIDDLSVLDF